jgi:hypothetical protein
MLSVRIVRAGYPPASRTAGSDGAPAAADNSRRAVGISSGNRGVYRTLR